MKNLSLPVVLGLAIVASLSYFIGGWICHSDSPGQGMNLVRTGRSFSKDSRSRRIRNNIEPMDGEMPGASASDIALAGTYRTFKDKGKFADGVRITIMAHKLHYKIGEPVRVIHVEEFLRGKSTVLMSAEPICDEYVDGKLVRSKLASSGCGARSVSGALLSGPLVNWGFDITTHRFSEPGDHTIQWIFGQGKLKSNLIKLRIDPRDA